MSIITPSGDDMAILSVYKIVSDLKLDVSTGQYVLHMREMDSLDKIEHGARFIISGRELLHAKHNIWQVHIERLQQQIAVSRLQRKPSETKLSYMTAPELRVPDGWIKQE